MLKGPSGRDSAQEATWHQRMNERCGYWLSYSSWRRDSGKNCTFRTEEAVIQCIPSVVVVARSRGRIVGLKTKPISHNAAYESEEVSLEKEAWRHSLTAGKRKKFSLSGVRIECFQWVWYTWKQLPHLINEIYNEMNKGAPNLLLLNGSLSLIETIAHSLRSHGMNYSLGPHRQPLQMQSRNPLPFHQIYLFFDFCPLGLEDHCLWLDSVLSLPATFFLNRSSIRSCCQICREGLLGPTELRLQWRTSEAFTSIFDIFLASFSFQNGFLNEW